VQAHAHLADDDVPAVPGLRAAPRAVGNRRAEAAKPKPLPPLCGECDNRWVETDNGMARCPRCNPRALEAS
jgi:hypothetical protein